MNREARGKLARRVVLGNISWAYWIDVGLMILGLSALVLGIFKAINPFVDPTAAAAIMILGAAQVIVGAIMFVMICVVEIFAQLL